jgi:hypothetical protein
VTSVIQGIGITDHKRKVHGVDEDDDYDLPPMATSSKQYKAIGEDLWKGRTEKIVRLSTSFAPCLVTADNLLTLT